MTDRLKEGLARLDRTNSPNVYRPDIKPVIEAARLVAVAKEPDIEAAAKALFLKDGNFSAKVWDALHSTVKGEWREMARITLAAALGVKPGQQVKVMVIT